MADHQCAWCQYDLNGVHKRKMQAELHDELEAAEDEIVAATINLATPYGRLEQQPTTTEE